MTKKIKKIKIKIDLTSDFKKKNRQSGMSEMDICVDAISYYIKHLCIPDNYFKGKFSEKQKLDYFTQILRDNFTL